MDKVTLDLRNTANLELIIDKGVSYKPSINGLNELDDEYTLTFPAKTYSVSNGGLTLVEATNSVIINIGDTDFEAGSHLGVFVSNSKETGVYIKIIIELNCDGGNY